MHTKQSRVMKPGVLNWAWRRWDTNNTNKYCKFIYISLLFIELSCVHIFQSHWWLKEKHNGNDYELLAVEKALKGNFMSNIFIIMTMICKL